MKRNAEQVGTGAAWAPDEGQTLPFTAPSGLTTGILREVRWGLVWRDFILEDGRVIPEHKVVGCPEQPVWRRADEVTQDERESWERRLVTRGEGGCGRRD